MHQSYPDIIDHLAHLIRNSHAETRDHGDGPSPKCRDNVDETTGHCDCVAEPEFWDENGVPRFAPHHPSLAPDIYADEVALLVISCQSCDKEFRVQMSWSMMDAGRAMLAAGSHGQAPAMLERAWAALDAEHAARGDLPSDATFASTYPAIAADRARIAELRAKRPDFLHEQITSGKIHYGNPPSTGCCPAGDTMNCWDLRVVEYWARSFRLRSILDPTNTDNTMTMEENMKYGWTRVPRFEIELPDATAEERAR